MRMNEYEAHDPGKEAFHRKYRKVLKAFAKRLGLPEGSYEVRSCKGGPAVLGEVILHSDKLYMQVHQGFTGEGIQVLYRSCNGRKDYSGGQNRYMPVDALEAENGGVAAVRAVAGL
jgi:hypothetical protein